MSWKIEFDSQAAKEFRKLDQDLKIAITNYLNNKILTCDHPKDFGKPLKYGYVGLWRYRIDKCRIICHIEEDRMIVLVLKIGKRDVIYE
ncbi:MAG: type II toxin-antitoxin system RelE/ParE family toxin [Sphingobacteriaceae bacterium]|nr:MAG: type II toxin-antitoxin system RelE/ParE family toxin [Sphingobacteriaceae bacterium]